MLQLVLSPLWVASQRWPWLKNIFDFKIDQWHVAFEFATWWGAVETWQKIITQRNDYWETQASTQPVQKVCS